jgi:hypothetical protein
MSFKRLEQDDFVVSADSITAGLWTGNAPELTSFITSSTQLAGASGTYYLNIYDSTDFDNIQFAIAYGNKYGSGSENFDDNVAGTSPTKTIYGQYRSLVLGDENADFVFGDETVDDFIAVSVDRNRYKESIFPGSMTMLLEGPSGNVLSLTDNSKVVTSVEFKDSGRVFQLVSGSAGTLNTSINDNGYSNSGSYGWLLPDIGTILLNPAALDAAVADGGILFNSNPLPDTDSEINVKLWGAFESSSASSFTLNSQETITSDFVFVRPRSSEFNYSENPSFISGSTGEVLYDEFINNPQVYMTTVGLYNDNSELLAVAKLSKPLLKDFTKESLVRVKLDF